MPPGEPIPQTLLNRKTTLEEILSACPFDPNRNLGRQMTPDVFFNHLFVHSKAVIETENRLLECLHSDVESARIIVCRGFSGTGKTTFLRYFQRNTSFDHEYIDCHSLIRNVNAAHRIRPISKAIKEVKGKIIDLQKMDSFGSTPTDVQNEISQVELRLDSLRDSGNPILSIIKSYLHRLDSGRLQSVLYLINGNKRALSPYFSRLFLDQLYTLNGQSLLDNVHILLNSAGLMDAFALFFLHAFIGAGNGRLVLVYFDNLDVVDLDYLSEYFQETFSRCLSNGTKLGQDQAIFPRGIDFVAQFRFIFCLRDGTGDSLNVHIADSLGHTASVLDFKMASMAESHVPMLEKRVAMWQKIRQYQNAESIGSVLVLSGQESRAESVAGILRQVQEDKYFRSVCSPLFNNDFRRLSTALLYVSKRFIDIGLEDLVKSLSQFSTADLLDQYGLRGCLLHGLIRYLRETTGETESFFFDMPSTEGFDECLISRMILTLLLNKSHYREGPGEYVERVFSSVPIDSIIDTASEIYERNRVICALDESFKFHRTNWVHLISYQNRSISYLEGASQVLTENDLESARLEQESLVSAAQASAVINPAGFVYLKHLLPHFEYYSVMSGNITPLFCSTPDLLSGAESRFQFENTIERVYDLVKRQTRSMSAFYRKKFENERGYDVDKYLMSDFAFKYVGDGAPKKMGVFHGARVITSHLDYVDKFRLLMIKRRCTSEQQARAVNKVCSSWIEQYVKLLESHKEFRMESLQRVFRERLSTIRDSGYSDMTTPIWGGPEPVSAERLGSTDK